MNVGGLSTTVADENENKHARRPHGGTGTERTQMEIMMSSIMRFLCDSNLGFLRALATIQIYIEKGRSHRMHCVDQCP